MGVLRDIAGVMGVVLLSACASLPEDSALQLSDLLADERVSRVALTRTSEGLLTIPVSVNGSGPDPFVVDTGATRSAVFSDRMAGMALMDAGGLRVHGIAQTHLREAKQAEALTVGRDTLDDVLLAVLPARKNVSSGIAPVGIIGMDVLGGYRLYVERGASEMVLIPSDLPSPVLPRNCGRVQLEANPWEENSRGLKYLTVRMNGRLAPALLDFGSDASVVNFAFAQFPEVRQVRRRLLRDYEIQGANGLFRPRVLVQGVNFRAGSRVWNDEDFIVRELDNLEILGVRSQPFMIAGANLFSDETFYLDFQNDVLLMPKSPSQLTREAESGPVTGSRAGGSSSTVSQATPGARSR